MTLSSPTLENLITLLSLCRRSAAWYHRLAQATSDSRLRNLATGHALRRRRSAAALERLIGSGAPPPVLAEPVAGSSDPDPLADCTAHEVELVSAYRTLADRDLEPYLQPLVLQQFEHAIEMHDEMLELVAASRTAPLGLAA